MPETESQDRFEHLSTALSISFNGPMFFDFAKKQSEGLVEIYVPYCPFHQAGFFFSTDSLSESVLYEPCRQQSAYPQDWPSREYAIEIDGLETRIALPTAISVCGGPTLKTRTPKPKDSSHEQGDRTEADIDATGSMYLLSTDGGIQTEADDDDDPTSRADAKRLFKLTVPMPQFISGLYFDFLEVVPLASVGPCNDKYPHCTAIRFYYPWDGSAVTLKTPNPQNGSPLITPPLYPQLPQLADIEVRYDGIGLEDENDPHSDARACFASLASLAGTDWWLYYSDGLGCPTNPYRPDKFKLQKLGHTETKTGSDCHAALITTGLSLP